MLSQVGSAPGQRSSDVLTLPSNSSPSPSLNSDEEFVEAHLEEAPPLLPPSYSLALGLDLQEDQSGFRKQHLEDPLGDTLADSASTSCPLTSHIQALTASELLKNR